MKNASKTPKTDHEIDIEFGQWLRDQRIRCGLTIDQAVQRTSLSSERLKALELGYAEKGISQRESEKICAAYKINLEDCLARASGLEDSDR